MVGHHVDHRGGGASAVIRAGQRMEQRTDVQRATAMQRVGQDLAYHLLGMVWARAGQRAIGGAQHVQVRWHHHARCHWWRIIGQHRGVRPVQQGCRRSR